MGSVHPIDLIHDGLPGAISAWLVLDPVPVVIDPGPTASLHNLKAGLAGHGLGVADLSRIVLTHIHLDHAGGTGQLVRENPSLEVFVHADGAPHMVDPTKLDASTRRTFGEAHDRLWGPVVPVPADRIRAWSPDSPAGLPGFEVLATPGHIGSHLAYRHDTSGGLMSGDSLGIRLGKGVGPHPPTPPPSLDVPAWEQTLLALAEVDAEWTGVAHFGRHEAPSILAPALLERLRVLVDRVRASMEAGTVDADGDAYEEESRALQAVSRDRAEVDRYFGAFSAKTDWNGIAFWLKRYG